MLRAMTMGLKVKTGGMKVSCKINGNFMVNHLAEGTIRVSRSG